MNGSLWALPIDAACQVAVSRPDLMRSLDARPPGNWSELVELGAQARRKDMHLAIGLAGVHSLMTFFTLMANLGSPCATTQERALRRPASGREALALMRDLLSFCPPEVLDWNSIRLHDEMVARDDLVFCPAVYCYATYAEADQRRPLRFHDLPGPTDRQVRRSAAPALPYRRAARTSTRRSTTFGLLPSSPPRRRSPDHHGQPALRGVWLDEAINARFGGCYRDTLATMDACWIRPRYNGYLGFQEKAGELVEAHLRGTIGESALLDRLERMHSGK